MLNEHRWNISLVSNFVKRFLIITVDDDSIGPKSVLDYF